MTKAVHGATGVKRDGSTLIAFDQAVQIIADHASPFGK